MKPRTGLISGARCIRCNGRRFLEKNLDDGQFDDRCLDCSWLHGSFVREVITDWKYQPRKTEPVTVSRSIGYGF